VALVLAAAAAASYALPALAPLRSHLYMYVGLMWWPLALGLLIGGVIDHFVPDVYVIKLLAGRRKRTVVSAVAAGFFMSLCSHGILALAVQLYKKGASPSSVVAFLLASPWANFTFTILLFSFFGVGPALYIVLAAVVVALTTGLAFQALERRGRVEVNPNRKAVADGFSIWRDLRRRLRDRRFSKSGLEADLRGVWRGALALGDMVMWWILLGAGLASLVGAYVPAEIFQDYFGPDLRGLLVTLGFATVIEVCSEGSIPLAFEIFRQTGAAGNAFIFLMAGVATDYTEIGLLWANVGRRTALWLPLLTVPQIIVWGMLANRLF
jgi:uncharacterized membrane protein YraQ (UPF0718 family)